MDVDRQWEDRQTRPAGQAQVRHWLDTHLAVEGRAQRLVGLGAEIRTARLREREGGWRTDWPTDRPSVCLSHPGRRRRPLEPEPERSGRADRRRFANGIPARALSRTLPRSAEQPSRAVTETIAMGPEVTRRKTQQTRSAASARRQIMREVLMRLRSPSPSGRWCSATFQSKD